MKRVGPSWLMWSRIAMALAITVGWVAPVEAHHSFAMFDKNKPMTIKGVVTRIEWTNPHAYLYVETTGEQGRKQLYALECSSPNELARWGWKRNTLKVGESVTLGMFPVRDGRPAGLVFSVKKADGTVLKAH